MLAFLNSQTRSHYLRSYPRSVLIAAVLTTTLVGCTEAAGLHEHEPYQGFPDSLSVPCSNGDLLVNCDTVRTSTPQDGHTLTAPPSYEVSGVDVIDKVTGLSWYRTPGKLQNHDAAINHCNVLPGDYRLPKRIELASLLDFRANAEVRIDTTMFPDVQPTIYWTSSRYLAQTDAYWAVDFTANATSTWIIHSNYSGGTAGVLCVKSAGDPFETGPFVIAGVEDRFLRDTRTGLMWMKKPLENGTTWQAAGTACQSAPDGGYNDFRVPNAKELATIVDEKKVGGSMGAIYNPFDTRDEFVWSSTPTRTPGMFFMLHTGGGSIGSGSGSEGYIRSYCVRGPD